MGFLEEDHRDKMSFGLIISRVRALDMTYYFVFSVLILYSLEGSGLLHYTTYTIPPSCWSSYTIMYINYQEFCIGDFSVLSYLLIHLYQHEFMASYFIFWF